MAEDFKGFKRVNFFTGFQTTAEDWNHVVRYDVDKHKLHNRLYHGPGVVPSVLGGFRVAARGRADLSVEIAPGHAIDGSGNDIFLPEPEIKTINPGDFKLPQTVYIVVKYVEDLSDFVSYRANLEYKGHRRVSERVKVEAIITEPDIEREVEVARIQLTKDVKRVTDAKDPSDPRPNELDLRFVPLAGVAGSRLSPTTLRELGEVLEGGRQTYAHLFHQMRILTAADVLHAMITLDLFLRLGVVDRQNLLGLFSLVFELQANLVEDIEANYPDFSAKKELASYKKHVELLHSMVAEGGLSPENLVNIVGYQRKGTENLRKLFGAEIKVRAKEQAAAAPTEALWDKIKIRSEEFGEIVEIEGIKLKRSDFIDLLDKRSEKDHKFRIEDARDKFRTRQKLKYPDGVIVEDVGIAHEGGYAEWEVSNIVPNKDLYMITRMDYVHGEWEAEVTVGGKKVGTSVCKGDDRKFRWRNWPFKIDAEYVTDTFLTIRQTPTTADRDINMFKIWFYQPL